MRISFRILASIILVVLSLIPQVLSAGEQRTVLVARVEGVINPVSAEFIQRSVKTANEMNAEALVIELDTPGGLDTSMRQSVKDIMASGVPVIVYVSPAGARAASAGVFITMSAHVAAMAPGTNIGAAHPVGVGDKMDKTMAEKATNDAAAYARSIAEKTGRNAQWAENAVRKSISATEKEAAKNGIVDLVSANLNQLLQDLNGREVVTASGKKTLRTADAEIVRSEKSLRQKILDFISDPNVAYMLMLLGFYGIFFELTNPGAIFPGVMGGICLILAFYAFQTLPVNYAGVLLIILALILFILEIKITSHGVLTIGGMVAMVIGSLMLFESPGPFMKLSLYLIVPAVGATALFFTVVLGLAYRAYRQKPVSGREGLVGEEGTALTEISAEGGMVSLHGEYWSATAAEPIAKGAKVTVQAVTGLKLKVRKA